MKPPRNEAIETLRASLTLVGLLASILPLAHGDPPAGEKWEPIPALTDEFDGPRLDPAKWLDHYPKWDGRKPGYFSRQNVSVAGGKLQITARREDLPNLPDGYHTFTTGAVRSIEAARYGYFEIKCRPMRSKASSGFWLNQGSPGWWTEIDVFEVGPVGGGRERTVYTSGHVFRAPGLEKGFARPGEWVAPFNLADDYHLYGLWWDEKVIRFYVDGAVIRVMENTHWHNPCHLNLNSEIKQTWFGLPDRSELPATFSIEYVRSWRKATPRAD